MESSSTLTISGAIGQSGGTFGVTKIATGTMVYAAAAANTYTGTTQVNLGELDFNSTAANGAIAGPLAIGTGIFGSGTVKYLASSQVLSTTDVTVNKNSTLNLNGYSDTINDLTVTDGLVSLPAGSSLTAAGLTMTGGDVNTGTGSTFTLSGDATIDDSAGGSTIDGTGSLNLGAGTPTITINATTPAVGLDIAIQITGAGGLTMTGGGTMEFSATSANAYTGTTTVDQGTLLLSDSGGEAIAGDLVVGDGTHTALVQEQQFTQTDSSNTDITVNASATFDFNGYDDLLDSMDVEGGTVIAGGAFVTLGGGLTMTGGSITTQSNGNFRLGTGGVTTNASSTTATISGNLDLGNATRTFTIAQGTTSSGVNLDVSATVTDGNLTKAGAGTMALDADNSGTYSGNTTISAGILQITNSGSPGHRRGHGERRRRAGPFRRDHRRQRPLHRRHWCHRRRPGQHRRGEQHGLRQRDARRPGHARRRIRLDADHLGRDRRRRLRLCLDGQQRRHRHHGLLGANTYAGTTTVAAGTLEITSNDALSSTSTGATVNSGATLEFAGNITISVPLTVSGTGVGGDGALVNLSGNNNDTGYITLGSNVTIGSDAGNLDLSGAIGGAGFGLTKVGDGELQLDGANTFDGGVTVLDGTVIATDSTSLGTGTGTVDAGGTLAVFFANTIANNLNIAGAGFDSQGALICDFGVNAVSGSITLTGSATIGGATRLDPGDLGSDRRRRRQLRPDGQQRQQRHHALPAQQHVWRLDHHFRRHPRDRSR